MSGPRLGLPTSGDVQLSLFSSKQENPTNRGETLIVPARFVSFFFQLIPVICGGLGGGCSSNCSGYEISRLQLQPLHFK